MCKFCWAKFFFSVCSCLVDFVRFRSLNGLKLLWELSMWGEFLAF